MKRKLLFFSFVLFLYLAGTAQVNLQAGLVAYYPFNGSVKDQSGNNNHPIFDNTKLVTDKQGNKNSACYFNGKNSYIRIKNNSSLCPQELSLVALVKPEGFYMGNCYNNAIIDKGVGDFIYGNYTLRFTAGEYTEGDCSDAALTHQNFVGFAGRNDGATSRELYVKLNQWYCVVYTFSKQSASMYVNGRLISVQKTNQRMGVNDEDIFIGKKNHPQFPYWFNGVLDEVRIYNRALNADEVKALCNLPQSSVKPVTDPCDGAGKPSAKFDYTITDCNTVNFRLLTVKNNHIKSIKWFFGDGTTSAETKPAHIYSRFGSFKVKAIVTSKQGCSDTVVKEIKLAGLNTDFVVSEKGEPGMVTFKAKNNKATYAWDFADGSTATNESLISHSYNASGLFTVRMFAKNLVGCTDTVAKSVYILLPEINAENKPITETAATTTAPLESFPTSKLEKREKDIIRTIPVKNDSLFIALYDNGIIDGDSVTILFNNQVLVSKQILNENPVRMAIKVDKNNPSNEVVMYADNLGNIPPNTALMVVTDGEERHTIIISSTHKTNGAVAFIRRD